MRHAGKGIFQLRHNGLFGNSKSIRTYGDAKKLESSFTEFLCNYMQGDTENFISMSETELSLLKLKVLQMEKSTFLGPPLTAG